MFQVGGRLYTYSVALSYKLQFILPVYQAVPLTSLAFPTICSLLRRCQEKEGAVFLLAQRELKFMGTSMIMQHGKAPEQ